MKNFTWFISVLTFCVFSSYINAQTGWVSQTNPIGFGDTAMIGKVQFVSEFEGWISCGDGRLLHTTDGGQIWDIIDPFPFDTINRGSDPAVAMSWVGTTHGWIIGTLGEEDSSLGSVIYYTTNAGSNWQRKVISNTPGDFGFQIQFVDINTGWLLTYNFLTQVATFLKTTDGGNNWFPFNGAGIFYFVDVNNGWSYYGSGLNGSQPPFKILRTTNGGTDWIEQFSDNVSGAYNAMHFTDVNNGWVVGDTGKVLNTTDGGTNWNYVTNTGVNVFEHCKTVFFLDANTGWISSKQNDQFSTPFLQHTTDGGITWETQISPFGSEYGYNAIFSIYFVNPQKGWITGDWGRIARYYGATDVKDEVNSVNSFSLDQNYPNPFNPTTMISYHLAASSNVTLKVYDILGNEVATVVNEFRPAGSYEVRFNANGLSSGIYLYRLNAGAYVDTKKLILIK